jgi:SAM-dependent methyltransferase
MNRSVKDRIKNQFSPYSWLYNALAVGYGWAAQKPGVRRAAYMRAFKDSRFAADELHMASLCPRQILDAVLDKWCPKTFLDVGCGTGKAIEYVSARGIECSGLEGSVDAINSSAVRDRIYLSNLNKPMDLGRKFDLVWSFEVAEHIHQKYAEVFLDTLTRHGDIIALSAAPPGQGGAGHFNEQPLSYWINKLTARAFRYEETFSSYLHTLSDTHSGNMMVFTR